MKKIFKKPLAWSVAFFCALGLAMAGLFASPQEFIQEPEPIVYEMPEDEPEKKKRTLKSCVRAIPAWARIVFLTPLWALGSFLLFLLKHLWKLAIAPLLPFILHWLLFFLLLCFLFYLLGKLLFPHLSLKQIFSRHALAVLFFGTCLLTCGDYFLTKFAEGFSRFGFLYSFSGGCLLLLIALIPAIQKDKQVRSRLHE